MSAYTPVNVFEDMPIHRFAEYYKTIARIIARNNEKMNRDK